MLDGHLVGDFFSHNALKITVNLGTGEVHKPEAMFFLKTDNIFCADGVALPQSFVKIFPVVSAELRCKMVNDVKNLAVKDFLYLPVISDVSTKIVFSV